MAPTKPQAEQPLAKIIALAILASIVSVLLLGVLGRILVRQMGFNNRIIGRKQAAQHQLDENIKALKKLTVEYDQLGQSKAVIADALPNTSDFPSLSGLMENIAKVSGVSLRSVSSASSAVAVASKEGTASASNGPKEFHFNISVNGSYSSLLTLIKNLELSARPMRVTVVSVGGASSGLDVGLSITTYYQDKASVANATEVIK